MEQPSKGPDSVAGVVIPRGRVSSAEFVDYHMILDHELSQLSRPETGVLGSFGFVGLGGVLGLAPNFFEAMSKLSLEAQTTFKFNDAITLICFALSLAGCLICLLLYAIGVYRNRGLASDIRNRKRNSMGDTRTPA